MIRRDALDELPAERLPASDPVAAGLAGEGLHEHHSRTDEAHPEQPAMPRHGATFLKHLRNLALGE
jgi:hypothetical protein